MIDLVAVVLLAAVGWVLLPADVRGALRVAASLPVGAAAFVTVELVALAVAPSVATPWTAMAATVALTAALAVRVRPAVRDVDRRPLAVGAVVVVAAVVGSHLVPIANTTVDSFRYVAVGTLLARGQLVEVATLSLPLKRGIAMGSLYGLAPPDIGYLRALGPLVGASTLAMLWTVLRRHVRLADRRLGQVAAGAAVLLLASTHRWAFSALYVNSHALVALWLLALVLLCWAVARGELPADGSTVCCVALLVTALTVARPEGVLVVVLALAPVVLDPGVRRRWRAAVLGAAGAATLVWHAGVLGARVIAPAGREWPVDVTGLIALGLVLWLVALALPLVDRVVAVAPGGRVGVLALAHGAVWLALAVGGLVNRETLLSAVEATIRNVTYDGLWGVSLIVLALLAAQGAVALAVDRADALLFPVVTFVPLGLLLGVVRGGAGYRVGAGDSLNRMLVHVVPLLVLYVGLLVAAPVRERWRTWSAGHHDRDGAAGPVAPAGGASTGDHTARG